MSDNKFPFGNDITKPDQWVGNMATKSQRWLVSYEGSFAIGCGYHSFIFLGLDSMSIGIANILNCGLSASLPIGKIFKALGGGSREALAFDKASDLVGNGKKSYDIAKMESEQNVVSSGMALYERMKKAIPQYMRSVVPFSLEDLAGMPGGIAGAEVEVVGAASIYRIEGYDSVRGALNSEFIFGPVHVANAGTGLVSAGVSVAVGVWSLEASFNLYWELGRAAQARCIVENSSPGYDQPYLQIPNLHPYLQSLPPAGCSTLDTHFSPSKMIPQPFD